MPQLPASTPTHRRSLLGLLSVGALLTLSSLSIYAAPPSGEPSSYNVVKILSFDCPTCYAYEAQDPVLARKVVSLGGKFVRAPIVSLKEDTGAKARIYYASRKWGQTYSDKISSSLYKGAQGNGLSLTDYPQAYTWLEQDLVQTSQDSTQLQALITEAQTAESSAAFQRALTLAYNAGVDALPAYLIVSSSGEIVATFTPETTPGGPIPVREAILAKLAQLSTTTPTPQK